MASPPKNGNVDEDVGGVRDALGPRLNDPRPTVKPNCGRVTRYPEGPPVIGREGDTANCDWLDLIWFFS